MPLIRLPCNAFKNKNINGLNAPLDIVTTDLDSDGLILTQMR